MTNSKKVGGSASSHRGPDPVDQVQQGVGGDFLVPQTEAFLQAHQVRGGEEPHRIAGPGEDGAEHGRHRALAVGAGNVEIAALLVGEVQPGQQVQGGGEAELDAEFL